MIAQTHLINYQNPDDPEIRSWSPAASVEVTANICSREAKICIFTGSGVYWPIHAIYLDQAGEVRYSVLGLSYSPDTMLAVSRFIHRINRTLRNYRGGTQYTEETVLAIGKEVAEETLYAMEDILPKLVLETNAPKGEW